MSDFDHRKFKVYQYSIRFVSVASAISAVLPHRKRFLTDQFMRAAVSIPLNIAEGAGEFSSREKARFYRIARRSTAECAAILDVLAATCTLPADAASEVNSLLRQIAPMLTTLIVRLNAKARHSSPSPSPSPMP